MQRGCIASEFAAPEAGNYLQSAAEPDSLALYPDTAYEFHAYVQSATAFSNGVDPRLRDLGPRFVRHRIVILILGWEQQQWKEGVGPFEPA